MPSRLVRSGILFGGAIAAANGLNALTQLVLARLLHPSEYSLLVTLFVVVTVAGIPLGALQAVVAREVAGAFSSDGDEGAGRALRGAVHALLRLCLPVGVVVVAACIPLAIVFHVQRPAALVATGCAIAASVGLTVVWGALQGTHRFNALAGGQLALSLAKLALAVAAAAAGAGVAGVMGAVAVVTAATLAAGYAPLARYMRASAGRVRLQQSLITRYSGGAIAALTVFAVLTTLDVVVSRLALTHDGAGAYAAASVAGRALLLVPTAATTVLFPRVATLDDRSRERRHLLAGAGVTAAVGCTATVVCALAGGPLVRGVFGNRYGAAGHWLWLLTLAMTLYGVAFVYLFHALSVGRSGFGLVALPLLAVQIAGFAAFHDTGRQLALVQVATAAVLVLAAETYDRRGT